jgi:CRP-like cAMP-binding protein
MPDSEDVLAQLGTLDLFSGLPRKDLKGLARAVREVRHPQGHRVVDEGGNALGFHLIVEGAATVTSNDTRRRTLGPGDYFGEISLIDGQPRSATVVADSPLRTLSLDSASFNLLLDEHPDIARSLLTVLCRRLRALEQAQ